MSQERSEEVQQSSLLPNPDSYSSKDLDSKNLRKAADSEVVPHRVDEVEIKKSKACFSETCFSLISYFVFTDRTNKSTRDTWASSH